MFEGILWDPIFFLWLLSLIAVLVYLFGRLWNNSYNKGEQVEPFLSGNEEQESNYPHASDMYWGFTEALKDYYVSMKEMHSNVVNDYVYWFVVVLALTMLVVVVS
ncbi:MAG: hydrogenase [Candidatus Diapherotrites archaeon]|nr:hydrogenase [Candidatus Diapherotrites archaeon]